MMQYIWEALLLINIEKYVKMGQIDLFDLGNDY